MDHLFSIITVTYNASNELLPTLESIKTQKYTNFELLIIDGGSKDNTIKIAENSNINNIYITSEPDKGLYDAMNKGIKKATGKYLIFLNAGDSFYNSDTLNVIAETISKTNPDIVYGQTQLVNSSRIPVGMRHLSAPDHLTFDSFKNGMLVCHQAFIVKRSIAGPYSLKYRFSADYEWCLRALKQSRINAYTGSIIINYLIDGMTDKNRNKSLKERFCIMCQYYGTISTIIKHISFIPRFISERRKRKKN